MLKSFAAALTGLAITAAAVSPAAAQRWDGYRGAPRNYQYDGYRQNGYGNGYPEYRRGPNYYRGARECRDGDGGTIIGAIAGGLLGRGISGRGDHLLGTVLGAGAGALAGRAIDRSDRPDYCRR